MLAANEPLRAVIEWPSTSMMVATAFCSAIVVTPRGIKVRRPLPVSLRRGVCPGELVNFWIVHAFPVILNKVSNANGVEKISDSFAQRSRYRFLETAKRSTLDSDERGQSKNSQTLSNSGALVHSFSSLRIANFRTRRTVECYCEQP